VEALARCNRREGSGSPTSGGKRARITLIEADPYYFRGVDATELATRHSHEEVAEWLWTGPLHLVRLSPAPVALPNGCASRRSPPRSWIRCALTCPRKQCSAPCAPPSSQGERPRAGIRSWKESLRSERLLAAAAGQTLGKVPVRATLTSLRAPPLRLPADQSRSALWEVASAAHCSPVPISRPTPRRPAVGRLIGRLTWLHQTSIDGG
jgi:hypothetical protein